MPTLASQATSSAPSPPRSAACSTFLSSVSSRHCVTNGGLGLYDPQVDALAVEWGAQGLAVANAAKHERVGLLPKRFEADGIYVGEVVVLSLVKGTPFDNGSATLEPSRVADKFWELYRQRTKVSATIS